MLANLSCDDIDLEGEEAGSVLGFWQLHPTNGIVPFLLISETEVIFYYFDSIKNCTTTDAYEIVRVDGTGFYILTQEGLEENRVLAISRNNSLIHVRDINDTQSKIEKYFQSDVDVNSLAPECVNPTDVFGQWELSRENEPTVYLSIASDSIKVIESFPEQECFIISGLEVLEINGNIFTISNNDPNSISATQEITITRTSEGIEVERIEDGETITESFIESIVDFSSFESVCSFGPLLFLEGIWKFDDSGLENSPEYYLTLGIDVMSFHFLKGDPMNDPENVCFEIEQFEITSIEEQSFSIKGLNEPFEEITYTLDFQEEEGLLYLDDNHDILQFYRSSTDSVYINNQCAFTTAN